MQGISRLVIATAALVGMFVVLLIYAANENNRLDVYAANFEGRSIEGGAALYTEACATCHGANGEGLVGPSLNDAELLVPAPGEVIPSRLIAKGWTGDLESFLTTAIGGGRVGTVMPAWGQVAGGPYNQAQVLDLAAYIMNWGLDPGKKWGGQQIECLSVVSRPNLCPLPSRSPMSHHVMYKARHWAVTFSWGLQPVSNAIFSKALVVRLVPT